MKIMTFTDGEYYYDFVITNTIKTKNDRCSDIAGIHEGVLFKKKYDDKTNDFNARIIDTELYERFLETK